jgi:excisionase family DNA binding protein
MPEIKKGYLSVSDASIYLGVKRAYIYQLLHKKKISCYKPLNGRVFFCQDDIDQFLSRYRKTADFEEGA